MAIIMVRRFHKVSTTNLCNYRTNVLILIFKNLQEKKFMFEFMFGCETEKKCWWKLMFIFFQMRH